MKLIKDANPGRKDGGYTRLFGDEIMGSLLSQCQATVISSGTELQTKIKSKIPLVKYPFIFTGIGYLDKPKEIKGQPDLILVHNTGDGIIGYVVELKAGDNFDTKKCQGEK